MGREKELQKTTGAYTTDATLSSLYPSREGLSILRQTLNMRGQRKQSSVAEKEKWKRSSQRALQMYYNPPIHHGVFGAYHQG